MQLLSCEHPVRVFNRFVNDYIWVPCGKCAICKNKRAAHYTELLEREKLQHPYSFFVTLTYSEESLPFISQGFLDNKADTKVYVSSRSRDCICIPFAELFPPDKEYEYYQYDDDGNKLGSADLDYFNGCMSQGGLPYASKTDVQLFLKRLNKLIHDKVTHKYQNFRYFIVSELGSTTFRPHFHGIFFVDSQECAEGFSDAVSSCWKSGIVDCQPVENSACGYVAQYINKSSDLPYVYQHRSLRPFFLCSRNPFIGTLSQCPEDDAEIVNKSAVTLCIRKKASDVQFSAVPLLQSYQNRLFPKCPSFGSVSDTVRTQLYTSLGRFSGQSLKGFIASVFRFMKSGSQSELCDYLNYKLSLKSDLSIDMVNLVYSFEDLSDRVWRYFDETSYNWLRRLYYFGKKVSRQACQFGISVYRYMTKIFQYYKNKELYLINKQYELQQEVAESDSDSIVLMYPEFLYSNGIYDFKDYIQSIDSKVCQCQVEDAEFLALSNKKTHFKNAYLDSLQYKNEPKYQFLFNLITSYLYAKKCNETLEAFAASPA